MTPRPTFTTTVLTLTLTGVLLTTGAAVARPAALDCRGLGAWAGGIAEVRDAGMPRQEALARQWRSDTTDRVGREVQKTHAEMIHAVYERPSYSPAHWAQAITRACEQDWKIPQR